MRLTVGEEVAEIGPGDMWHAPGNVVHGGEILGDEPVVFVDVYSPARRGVQIGRRLTARLPSTGNTPQLRSPSCPLIPAPRAGIHPQRRRIPLALSGVEGSQERNVAGCPVPCPLRGEGLG